MLGLWTFLILVFGPIGGIGFSMDNILAGQARAKTSKVKVPVPKRSLPERKCSPKKRSRLLGAEEVLANLNKSVNSSMNSQLSNLTGFGSDEDDQATHASTNSQTLADAPDSFGSVLSSSLRLLADEDDDAEVNVPEPRMIFDPPVQSTPYSAKGKHGVRTTDLVDSDGDGGFGEKSDPMDRPITRRELDAALKESERRSLAAFGRMVDEKLEDKFDRFEHKMSNLALLKAPAKKSRGSAISTRDKMGSSFQQVVREGVKHAKEAMKLEWNLDEESAFTGENDAVTKQIHLYVRGVVKDVTIEDFRQAVASHWKSQLADRRRTREGRKEAHAKDTAARNLKAQKLERRKVATEQFPDISDGKRKRLRRAFSVYDVCSTEESDRDSETGKRVFRPRTRQWESEELKKAKKALDLYEADVLASKRSRQARLPRKPAKRYSAAEKPRVLEERDAWMFA